MTKLVILTKNKSQEKPDVFLVIFLFNILKSQYEKFYYFLPYTILPSRKEDCGRRG